MTSDKRFPGAYACYVETLVEYDGPQVVLLESKKGGIYICVPIDDPVEGFSIPFLAVGVSKRDLDLYLDEAFDLNYLMEFKSSIRSYVFDISKEKNGYFHLKYVDEIHAKKDHYLPDAGFFARNHTRHYKKNDPKYVITHTYYIDGRWTTADFSRFYAKLSDLYAIYTIADVVDDNVTAEEKLEAAITSYTFQGGGSYRGSFRDLGDAANDNYPLKVSRIQYASPGRIDVKGIERPLRFVDGIIDGFLDRKENLKENARNLYIILQHDGALGNRMYKFSNIASDRRARSLAKEIFTLLALPNLEKVQEICSDRPVVFAKLALALYRRALAISRFHEEGRVSLEPR